MTKESLVEALLDSWDRNARTMSGLLRVIPEHGMAARPYEDGPTVAQYFTHAHYIRLVQVFESAPEFAGPVPEAEWVDERDPARVASMLDESAAVVRAALAGCLGKDRVMDVHYDHPVLLLEHLVWHEGYHHGQIKLALHRAGLRLSDRVAGPESWAIWMDKTR